MAGQTMLDFEIDAFRKQALVEGLDDIGLTLRHDAGIRAFEARHVAEWPWAVPARVDAGPAAVPGPPRAAGGRRPPEPAPPNRPSAAVRPRRTGGEAAR